MRCITQRRLSSPASESGQNSWICASHRTSAICLARLPCRSTSPLLAIATDDSPIPVEPWTGGRGTPGIVRSSSCECDTSTGNGADRADKSSSFEGKFAQTIIQTRINPPPVTRLAMVFADCSVGVGCLIEVSIKESRWKITETGVLRRSSHGVLQHKPRETQNDEIGECH